MEGAFAVYSISTITLITCRRRSLTYGSRAMSWQGTSLNVDLYLYRSNYQIVKVP